jgi:hypothetical protein
MGLDNPALWDIGNHGVQVLAARTEAHRLRISKTSTWRKGPA